MNHGLALDTNAYTALGRGDTIIAEYVAKTARIGLPITVLGEIYFGALNGTRAADNISLINRFLKNPRVEILGIDKTTTKLFGEIATELRRLGRPIQQNDIWIAAICKQSGFVLATNDRGYHTITGLEVLEF